MRLVVDPGVDAGDVRQLDDLGASDPRCQVVPRPGERGPRHDERRYADGAENIAHVELHGRPKRGEGRSRAEASTHVPYEPFAEALVGDLRSPFAREPLEVGALAPASSQLRELLPPFLDGR